MFAGEKGEDLARWNATPDLEHEGRIDLEERGERLELIEPRHLPLALLERDKAMDGFTF